MLTAQVDREDEVFQETLSHLIETLMQQMKTRRVALIASLRKEWGDTEETGFLLDYLEEAWATLDQLTDKVGAARALTLILCGYNHEKPIDEESEGPLPMEAHRGLCILLSNAGHSSSGVESDGHSSSIFTRCSGTIS